MCSMPGRLNARTGISSQGPGKPASGGDVHAKRLMLSPASSAAGCEPGQTPACPAASRRRERYLDSRACSFPVDPVSRTGEAGGGR